ncbi:acyltransferase family protein [Pseudomonas sp. CFBP 13710]|uniref:acyltransferase family protein n=1 Tax=Pseudomonas sp. CFBP 13710 TaxID=2775311 RepID=UPI00178301BA|nr:acyltransferase [Pseudomonas sp. CFBP 13710]MBD8729759.1 acyltransferase [Pseudomonas sp. CFBP 13710]
MTASPPSAARLYTLDTLRGLAALCVVFWHWQHFFYVADDPSAFVAAQQPFFATFKGLYGHGGLAVQLFFSISGFVFFWLFARKISERSITANRFALDRFSRLYPLHIVTFVVVAALQVIYGSMHSSSFVYQANDAYHAILNVFLAPAWGFEKGWSFNAPIWSVSVEVLLYATFFLICLTGRFLLPLAVLMCALGAYLYPDYYKQGSGLLCFYVGGLTYISLQWLERHAGPGRSTALVSAACAAAWVYQLGFSDNVNTYFVMCVGFPLLIAALAGIGRYWPNLLRSGAVLGDISYASYLIHFPLQIVFALTADKLGFARAVFYQGWVMLLFFAVLIVLSMLSHRFLERPAQRFLRAREARPLP